MNWLSLALGLIREAASTDAGKNIINDLRSGAFRKNDLRTAQDLEGLKQVLADQKAVADRNFDMLVQMVNSQNEILMQVQKRQRIWNIGLASGAAVAIVLAVIALLR